MITEKKVLKEVRNYRLNERYAAMLQRQKQYQNLVKIYGMDIVATASGLTPSTIRQHISASTPNIGYEPLAQAIAVLTKIG